MEDDIYKNKVRYERLMANLDTLTEPPSKTDAKRKYYCKNPENLKYFRKLDESFAPRNLSYIRRLRLLNFLKLVVHSTSKDLKYFTRKDIDSVIAVMFETLESPKSQTDFLRDLKTVWRILFPERDTLGRIDESIMPYVVRHVKCSVDRSRQRAGKDRLSIAEVERILGYFSGDRRMQAFLSLIYFGLARPQEILFCRIRDFEDMGGYGRLHITEHGKEGTKFIELFDAFPYISDWLNEHPNKSDPNAWIFVNYSRVGSCERLSPDAIRFKLRRACKGLGIDKPITAYSFKRVGVTHLRLAGTPDVTIQHRAGWTSTKQIRTYDQSGQSDSFKAEAVKRGFITAEQGGVALLTIRKCIFCGFDNKPTDVYCGRCKRSLDREKAIAELQETAELKKMVGEISELRGVIDLLKRFGKLEAGAGETTQGKT